MKTASFLLQPDPGTIVQIYRRHCLFDFLIGYCRAVLHAGGHVMFADSFRRRSDPQMTAHWAEPHDFGIQLFERYSFELAPEAEWMSLTKPPQRSP